MAQETTMEKMEIVVKPIESIVENENGEMFTTSLIIAEAFEKEHKNVLRDIENLECSPEFHRLNFAPMVYEAEIGSGAKREFPAYRLTRDGFAFLAMGFTGKKAAAWKEKFLEAFNAMEKALQEKMLAGMQRLPEMPPRESAHTRMQRIIKALRGIAAYWAFVDEMEFPVAELALCTHLGIERLDQLTEDGDGSKIIQEAFSYLWTVSNRPTGDHESYMITQNEIIMLRHMLTACGQWKFTRDQNFEEYFEELTGINIHNIESLSSHDARKMLATAGCLLHQTYQYSLDWVNFAEGATE